MDCRTLGLKGGSGEIALPGASDVNTAAALYWGFFGTTLYAAVDIFWGKDGLLPYWTVPLGPLSTFMARMFGAAMTALAAAHLDESIKTSKTMSKVNGLLATLMIPLFLQNWKDTANFGATFFGTGLNIWAVQMAVHLPLTALCLNAGFN
jgi:hypothetical protein